MNAALVLFAPDVPLLSTLQFTTTDSDSDIVSLETDSDETVRSGPLISNDTEATLFSTFDSGRSPSAFSVQVRV